MKKILIFLGLKIIEIGGLFGIICLSSIITAKVERCFGFTITENFFERGLWGIVYTIGVFVIVFCVVLIVLQNIEWAERLGGNKHNKESK